MKKILFVLTICFLLVSCKNKTDDISNEGPLGPLTIELTQEEEDYFNQIFGEIVKENNLTYVDKHQLEMYSAQSNQREKHFFLRVEDNNSTYFDMGFNRDKQGCIVKVLIPHSTNSFSSEKQLDLFMDLFEVTLGATDADKKEIYQHILPNFEEVSEISRLRATNFSLSKLVVSPDGETTVILSIRPKKGIFEPKKAPCPW